MKRFFLLVMLCLTLAGCQEVAPHIASATVTYARPADPANAAPREVSMNGVGLAEPSPAEYKFLVVGHLYGTIEGSDRLPDKALLNRLPELKTSGLSMLISLGDMVKASKKADFDELDRRLLRPLPFPVFNTPGNHDVEDRALYESRYGQTFYSFRYGTARLVFLDTVQAEGCAIDTAQMGMLTSAIRAARSDAGTKSILIFMHKTMFLNNDRLFALKKRNAQPNGWDCYGAHSYAELEQNILQPTATKKPIYLFAGDVGAWGNLTPYYERRADLPITMVMTGLGDTPNDAGILVTVTGDQVRLAAYPLAGQSMPPLETYTPEYWVQEAEKN